MTKSAAEAGADAVKSIAKGNPMLLMALACLALAGVVSVVVPRVFAAERPAAVQKQPDPGAAVVTVDALRAALLETSKSLLIEVRSDLKVERDERLRTDHEVRAALERIAASVSELRGATK